MPTPQRSVRYLLTSMRLIEVGGRFRVQCHKCRRLHDERAHRCPYCGLVSAPPPKRSWMGNARGERTRVYDSSWWRSLALELVMVLVIAALALAIASMILWIL